MSLVRFFIDPSKSDQEIADAIMSIAVEHWPELADVEEETDSESTE